MCIGNFGTLKKKTLEGEDGDDDNDDDDAEAVTTFVPP